MLLLCLAACAPEGPPAAVPVPAAAHLALAPDPGPPPHERPRVATLWAHQDGRWRAIDRVQAVAPGDRARVDAQGRLIADGKVVADRVLPHLVVAADGTLLFTRAEQAPQTDVWRLRAKRATRGASDGERLGEAQSEPRTLGTDGTPEAITHDGQSDRPFPLPDGRLLWISGAGGRAGFILDGQRLTNHPGQPFVPVPAFPDRTRLEGDRVIYDAGDAEWWINPTTGEAGRL